MEAIETLIYMGLLKKQGNRSDLMSHRVSTGRKTRRLLTAGSLVRVRPGEPIPYKTANRLRTTIGVPYGLLNGSLVAAFDRAAEWSLRVKFCGAFSLQSP
jgi:hypothetical protein